MLIFLGIIALFVIIEVIRGYISSSEKIVYLVKTFLGLALVTLILFLIGPFFVLSPVKIGYTRKEAPDFVLYYPKDKEELGQSIFTMAESAVNVNREFYRNMKKASIVVATSELDMLRFGSYPKAGGTGNELVINIRDSKASTNIIVHEMSHRNLAHLLGKPPALFMPRWFDEGLASYLGEMDYYKSLADLKIDLETGKYQKDLINWQGFRGHLNWLIRAFSQRESKLIYGQSYQLVKYLFGQYGSSKVYDFVVKLKETSYREAFRESFGITPEEFHQNFLNLVSESQ